MDASPLILTRDEIVALTGGYLRPADQLAELQRQGFTRARRSRVTGEVVLERAHFEAVSAGQRPENRPRVRPPKLRIVGVT